MCLPILKDRLPFNNMATGRCPSCSTGGAAGALADPKKRFISIVRRFNTVFARTAVDRIQNGNSGMKGTELVFNALVDNGVKFIVGYTGEAIMPIFDAMKK